MTGRKRKWKSGKKGQEGQREGDTDAGQRAEGMEAGILLAEKLKLGKGGSSLRMRQAWEAITLEGTEKKPCCLERQAKESVFTGDNSSQQHSLEPRILSLCWSSATARQYS